MGPHWAWGLTIQPPRDLSHPLLVTHQTHQCCPPDPPSVATRPNRLTTNLLVTHQAGSSCNHAHLTSPWPRPSQHKHKQPDIYKAGLRPFAILPSGSLAHQTGSSKSSLPRALSETHFVKRESNGEDGVPSAVLKDQDYILVSFFPSTSNHRKTCNFNFD